MTTAAAAAARKLPPVELGPLPRAVLACIQVPTDFVLDSEGPAMVAGLAGVELRLHKLALDADTIDEATFLAGASRVGDAAAALRPRDRHTVVGLACTSLSFTLGAAAVDAQLNRGLPGAAATDMARAQAAALAALGAGTVALVTPYVASVAAGNVAMLEAAGITVVASATMGLDRDELTTRVEPSTIAAWCKATDVAAADAVVVGCSAFRACERGFIDALEADLGKPVVTSTQAFMWHMLRTAGVDDRIPGYGALLSAH